MSSVIESFFNEIKNQFSTSIRVLCTDNVLEYVEKDVTSFFFQNWNYLADFLFSYNPTKWVAERKHRHILYVAKTLMIHMSVPKYLWSDAVLSACYLINRISSILNIRSQFSYLYANKTPFSMTLCVLDALVLFRTCLSGLVSWAR